MAHQLLEVRRVLAVDVQFDPATGELTITGDDEANKVYVCSQDIGGQRYVTVGSGAYNEGIYWNGANAPTPVLAANVTAITVFGMGGEDTLSLGTVNELSYGFSPVLNSNIYVYGGLGKDTILGSGFRDHLYGYDADDPDTEEFEPDQDESDDLILGFEGNDVIYGGKGNDRLLGGDGDDVIYGGLGDDKIAGDAGIDQIYGEQGDDTIEGGDDSDYIYGGPDNDRLYGWYKRFLEDDDDPEVDQIANHGTDLDTGDQIYGDGGQDIIHGDLGNDIINGGARFGVDLTDSDDKIYGDEGDDVIHGSLGADQINGGAGNDILYSDSKPQGGTDIVHGGDDNDELHGGDGIDQLFGDGGEDILYPGAALTSVQTMFGGAGNDIFYGNTITGSLDGDVRYAFYGNSGNDTIWGTNGRDIISGGSGDDTIYALDGKDEIFAGIGNDYVDGGEANDVIYGDSDDAEHGVVFGGLAGDDRLIGGDGDDVLRGEGGDDRLWQDAEGGAWAPYDPAKLIGGTGHDWLNAFDDQGTPEGSDPEASSLLYDATNGRFVAVAIADQNWDANGQLVPGEITHVWFFENKLNNNPGPGETPVAPVLNYLRDTSLGSETSASPENGFWYFDYALSQTPGTHVYWAMPTDAVGNRGLPAKYVKVVKAVGQEGAPVTINLAGNTGFNQFEIDWGDGSPAESLAGFTTSASHVYADGPLSSTITITADGQAYDSFPVEISNVAPALSVAQNQQVYTGQALNVTNIGSFTDPGFGQAETWVYDVDWSDGPHSNGTATVDQAGSAGTSSAGSFDGQHTYLTAGTYTAHVKVTDDDGGTDTKDVTIVVTDPPVSLSAPTPTTAEYGAAPGKFEFSRPVATTLANTIGFSIGGSATISVDYDLVDVNGNVFQYSTDPNTGAKTSSVTIAAGETAAAVFVRAKSDGILESTESVQLTVLAGSGYQVGSPAQADVNITDVTPVVSISSGSPVTEGNSGQKALNFTIQLDRVFDLPVTVYWDTIDGTATIADADYGNGAPVSGSTVIAAGSLTGTATVLVNGDGKYEADETLQMRLLSATNGTLGNTTQATGTITNDDDRVSIAAVMSDEPESSGTPGRFTVTRLGPTTSALTVNFSIGGSATNGVDYQNLVSYVTILAGQTTANIDVQPIQDYLLEGSETVDLGLTSGGYEVDQNALAAEDRIDDSTPNIGVTDISVPEGGVAVFTVTLAGAPFAPVTVTYNTSDGTATAGTDYTAKSGMLTFAAGETSKTVSVSTLNDFLAEGNETFHLNLTSPNGAVLTNNQATATITPPPASVAVNSVSVAEGGVATFTVTLTGTPLADVTVNYNTADHTATAGSDYTAASGAVTFTSGQTTKTITVTTLNDFLAEGNEDFYLNLTTASAAVITTAQGTGTITPPPAGVVVNDVSVAEGGVATFTLTLSGTPISDVVVNYATADNTATAGSDYTAASGSVTFTAGQTTKTVSVTTLNDFLAESNESFYLNLSTASGAVINDSQGVGTITPPPGSVSVSNASATEGSTATFTITLGGSPSGNVTVNYTTANNTATSGSDYTAASGSVTFTAGQTTKTVSVSTLTDMMVEGNETFYLNLTTASGAVISGSGQGTGTISDPPMPSVSISGPVGQVNEGSMATFTVTVSMNPGSMVMVSYATANGTAMSPMDFANSSGSLMFMPGGSLTQTISVMVYQDMMPESAENFYMNLSGVTGGTLGTSQAQATIAQNGFESLSVEAGERSQNPTSVTAAQVKSTLGDVLKAWNAAGASQDALRAVAANLQVEVVDLPQTKVGAFIDGRLFVDATADGYGWYVDATPGTSEEFSATDFSTELVAAPSSAAAGRVDLVTVLSHEVGHLLGYPELEIPHDVMADVLPLGVRRLPAAGEGVIEHDNSVSASNAAWSQINSAISLMYLHDHPTGTSGGIGTTDDNAGYALYYFSKLSQLPYLSDGDDFGGLDNDQQQEIVELAWDDFNQMVAEDNPNGDFQQVMTEEEIGELFASWT